MLASLIILGLAGSPATRRVAAISFGTLILLLAWLGQRSLREAQKRAALTWKQWAWNAAVFVAWVAFTAGVVLVLW